MGENKEKSTAELKALMLRHELAAEKLRQQIQHQNQVKPRPPGR